MTERAIHPAWHSRVVLLTGGTSGIGLGIASALLDAGARVAISG
jgi:NAD(P)-dependent dehydrogenase (short-subunit alcohol dehydrogenase family)